MKPTLPVPPARQADRGRAFISAHPLRSLTVDGGPAFAVKIRLTSYRSLPLSCVERIALTVDGVDVDPADIRFVLGRSYRLDELAEHSSTWWFILDHAELVVRTAEPLAPGRHRVDGTLVTVEPYVSNGRFHFTSTASQELTLDPAAAVAG